MNRRCLPALVASSFVALTVSACAADQEEEPSDSASSALAPPPDDGTRHCAILDFSQSKPSFALPPSTAGKVFMEKYVADANKVARASGDPKVYTVADFGPYKTVSFRMKARKDVKSAVLTIAHTLPTGVTLPEHKGWSGALPAGFEQPVTLEIFHDPVKNGEAARVGRHTGEIRLTCDGIRSTQPYSFER